MKLELEKSWQTHLKSEFEKGYFKDLMKFIEEEYATQTIYPPKELIFNAFNLCTFDNLKIVIIGQDPYHGKNQANGLAFSVNKGVKIPPSLRNIYKELNSDIGKDIPEHGNLQDWAEQGVLMINASFTVREANAGSHQKRGWETFTDSVIKLISDKKENVIFMLWGAFAQKKGKIIDKSKHYMLESAHPSPLSAHRGFLGNKHFSKANKYLISIEKEPINW